MNMSELIKKNKLVLFSILILIVIYFLYNKHENINNLQPTNWSCDNGGYNAPMRVNSAGDIECMGPNNRDCFWKANAEECKKTITDTKPEDIKPLACGEMSLRVWGGTGYDTPGHWCSDMAKFMTAKQEKEAKIKAEQEAKIKAEQEAKIKAEQEAKIKAEQEAKIKAEQEAKIKADQDAKLKADQDAKLKAEQEAMIKAEQEAMIKAEQEAKIKADQDAKLKADQDAKIKAEQDTSKNRMYMILSSVCCCICLIALVVVIMFTQKKSAKKPETQTETITQ